MPGAAANFVPYRIGARQTADNSRLWIQEVLFSRLRRHAGSFDNLTVSFEIWSQNSALRFSTHKALPVPQQNVVDCTC